MIVYEVGTVFDTAYHGHCGKEGGGAVLQVAVKLGCAMVYANYVLVS